MLVSQQSLCRRGKLNWPQMANFHPEWVIFCLLWVTKDYTKITLHISGAKIPHAHNEIYSLSEPIHIFTITAVQWGWGNGATSGCPCFHGEICPRPSCQCEYTRLCSICQVIIRWPMQKICKMWSSNMTTTFWVPNKPVHLELRGRNYINVHYSGD